MNIIQIASQYTSSKVYRELIRSLSMNKEIHQKIYIPMRTNKLNDKYKLENCLNNVEFYYRVTYNKLDRILYYSRINKTRKNIENEINMKNIDFIHAHTLFADGGLAYQLNRKYGIPYIVAVRSTDVKEYLKKMPHCIFYLNKIIKNANKIIFISPNMQQDLEKHLTKKMIRILREKTIIKPNGIESYWFENINLPQDKHNIKNLKLVQVSELDINKNLYATLNVVQKLNNSGIETNLNVVGTGREEERYKQFILENGMNAYVKFLGYISDKEQLKNVYRNSDIFIMLSKRETFGLVYIEAMSQGLPIIHTKGTGIDGFFENGKVGYALDLNNLDECVDIVKKIIQNYKEISINCIEKVENFRWDRIAQDYIKLYQGGK